MNEILMVVVLKNDGCKNKVLRAMRAIDKNGTVIPTNSIKHALLRDDVEPLPIFGGLRQLVDDPSHLETTILLVMNEDELKPTRDAIVNATKDNPTDVALIFALPVIYHEIPGVKKQ